MELKKGEIKLSWIESTNQWDLNLPQYGGATLERKEAQELIDLLEAYLIMTKRRTE